MCAVSTQSVLSNVISCACIIEVHYSLIASNLLCYPMKLCPDMAVFDAWAPGFKEMDYQRCSDPISWTWKIHSNPYCWSCYKSVVSQLYCIKSFIGTSSDLSAIKDLTWKVHSTPSWLWYATAVSNLSIKSLIGISSGPSAIEQYRGMRLRFSHAIEKRKISHTLLHDIIPHISTAHSINIAKHNTKVPAMRRMCSYKKTYSMITAHSISYSKMHQTRKCRGYIGQSWVQIWLKVKLGLLAKCIQQNQVMRNSSWMQ